MKHRGLIKVIWKHRANWTRILIGLNVTRLGGDAVKKRYAQPVKSAFIWNWSFVRRWRSRAHRFRSCLRYMSLKYLDAPWQIKKMNVLHSDAVIIIITRSSRRSVAFRRQVRPVCGLNRTCGTVWIDISAKLWFALFRRIISMVGWSYTYLTILK